MRDGRISKHLFTAAQWQELEQQFLIYNYMASGIPIPPELILLIRRSLLTTINLPTLDFFNPQPTIPVGWVDIGRKAEDPEPWRCRRTDGKKWRCSRKAYTDSKYCERHMHRGKNRSRKLVEMSSVTMSIIPPTISSQYPPPRSMHLHPSYPSRCPELGFVGCKNDTHFWPLEMSFLHELKQSYTTQQRTGSHFRDELPEEKQRHCFVLGADLMLAKPLNVEREKHDEGPIKNKEKLVPVEAAYHDFLLTNSGL